MKWRSFRESEDSRFVVLTMPRSLSRLPYGKNTKVVEEFDFEEVDLDEKDEKKEDKDGDNDTTTTTMMTMMMMGLQLTGRALCQTRYN